MSIEVWALKILPTALLILSAAVLVNLFRESGYLETPHLFLFISLVVIRCVVYLCAMWRTNTVLGYVAPIFALLAAEELIRLALFLFEDRARRWRYWFSLGIAMMTGAAVWYSRGSPWMWRAAVYSGCCAALLVGLLHSWLLGWAYLTVGNIRKAQIALLVFCGAAACSTHPAFGWWTATVITEAVQCAAMVLFYVSLPPFNNSIRTSLISSRRSSA